MINKVNQNRINNPLRLPYCIAVSGRSLGSYSIIDRQDQEINKMGTSKKGAESRLALEVYGITQEKTADERG